MNHGLLLGTSLLLLSVLVASSDPCRAENGPAARPGAEQLKAACSTLAGRVIPAASIGLPSGDASVASAVIVVANAAATPATPDFCKVLGSIAPIDPAAQLINFEINLPISWNGKALQYGGGGYNGVLITGLAPLRDAAPDDPLPLMRGYATFGTDSGHQASAYAPANVAQFGLNDEMLLNYAYASYKKVKDVSVDVIRAFYDQSPSRTYYFGGSEGGREGLTMAQRFPADYDGIVSVVPAIQISMIFQAFVHHEAPQLRGGWVSPAKVGMFAKFVADRCDALDGLADGVINNYLGCPAKIDLQQLRCADGADSGDTCLSDKQIAAIAAVHSPYTLPFPVANGLSTYPKWLYGNEITPDPRSPHMVRWVTGAAVPTSVVDPETSSIHWLYGANFVRFFVTKDATFDPGAFDPEKFRDRLLQLSELLDSTNPDLSVFFARGGKLIIRSNSGDLALSPLSAINYVDAVTARIGKSTVDQSVRLFISPASTHSGPATSVTDGKLVPTMVDLLDPLDKWVNEGVPPADALVQTVKETAAPFKLLASRPMCRYPNYPHYAGGDRLRAESYRCMPSSP
ncbi:tannase/feruloyl esterase family alpha/beta hydrolase [Bradyrhizobium jicamae]|uniref:tannase/feruloyl esterase family alpha/beta hydrolase n=1 Tax=Bradyrhizobium jicamae TaxID=280332 RepID=UPI001BA5ECE0|nr:tannase/feruloyl esterase family alpha/beta hydrolase [Bradyrhizobium jicamae]MBR0756241.1 tannase/feruloyl esterase family alpha/beta hydrolase [Bradyrhizobium jicamae]